MLHHGGNLLAAARQYGIAVEQWLDLSTGINPSAYPVSAIDSAIWQRLPQAEDGLHTVARRYYGAAHLLATAGSQAVLQLLPQLRQTSRIAIPLPTYNEHPNAWQRAGHQLLRFEPDCVDSIIQDCDVLLLCNPNNPSGHRYTGLQLQAWQHQLAERGGWLIVDEAFMDVTPEHSIAFATGREGLIVLRSLGKFFGLAGARVGFVLAWPELLNQVQELLGPWHISGPSRLAAIQALSDQAWQQQMRVQLLNGQQRLTDMLCRYGLAPTATTALFQWLAHPAAATLHRQFAERAILTRLFAQPNSLRFGLPGNESQWQQLEQALDQIVR